MNDTDYTITRRMLVNIALDVIQQHQEDVDSNTRHHLMYAACTMEQVALGGWIISPTCGCLVGTMQLNAAEDDEAREMLVETAPDPGSALYMLGCEFDECLLAAVGVGPRDFLEAVVRVLD